MGSSCELETREWQAHDEPLRCVVRGLAPGAEIEIRVSVLAGGREWTSSASFRATELGEVDVSSQSPLRGSYRGVDGHGLMWSLTTQGRPVVRSVEWDQARVRIDVSDVGGKPLARADVLRGARSERIAMREIEETGVSGRLYLPAGERRGVAIVLPGSHGGIPDRHACLLANRGVAALALAVTAAPGPWKRPPVAVELVHDAMDHLKAELPCDRVSLLGLSLGGSLALLAAEGRSDVAAVACMSSPVVVMPTRMFAGRSSYTRGGRPVPSLEIPLRAMTRLLRRSSGRPTQASVLDELVDEIPDRARVRLQDVQGAVLLVLGTQDGAIHERFMSPEDSFPNVKVAVYPGAGHLTTLPGLPAHPQTAGWGRGFGGSTEMNGPALIDAWRRVLVHLGATVP